MLVLLVEPASWPICLDCLASGPHPSTSSAGLAQCRRKDPFLHRGVGTSSAVGPRADHTGFAEPMGQGSLTLLAHGIDLLAFANFKAGRQAGRSVQWQVCYCAASRMSGSSRGIAMNNGSGARRDGSRRMDGDEARFEGIRQLGSISRVHFTPQLAGKRCLIPHALLKISSVRSYGVGSTGREGRLPSGCTSVLR